MQWQTCVTFYNFRMRWSHRDQWCARLETPVLEGTVLGWKLMSWQESSEAIAIAIDSEAIAIAIASCSHVSLMGLTEPCVLNGATEPDTPHISHVVV